MNLSPDESLKVAAELAGREFIRLKSPELNRMRELIGLTEANCCIMNSGPSTEDVNLCPECFYQLLRQLERRKLAGDPLAIELCCPGDMWRGNDCHCCHRKLELRIDTDERAQYMEEIALSLQKEATMDRIRDEISLLITLLHEPKGAQAQLASLLGHFLNRRELRQQTILRLKARQQYEDHARERGPTPDARPVPGTLPAA